MPMIFMDGFEQYAIGEFNRNGTSRNDMLNGVWAEVPDNYAEIVDQGRTGNKSIGFTSSVLEDDTLFRYVLPQAKDSLYFFIAVKIDELKLDSGVMGIQMFYDSANNELCVITFDRTGRLVVDISGQNKWVSTDPVFQAGTWYAIETKYTASGKLIVLVDGEESASIDIASAKELYSVGFGGRITILRDMAKIYFDDVIIRDATGEDPLIDCGVYALPIVSDGEDCTWTPSYIAKAGEGVFWNIEDNDYPGIAAGKDSRGSLSLLAQDFTLEMFIKFTKLPDANEHAVLLAQWVGNTVADQSYRLYLGGSAVSNGSMVFEYNIASQQQAVKLTTTKTDFNITQWYHVAVSRYGNDIMLFVDGVLQANTDIGEAIVAPATKNAITILTGTKAGSYSLNDHENLTLGYVDEIRVTLGLCRYKTNYVVPPEKLPRNDFDEDFDKVKLLIGFDGAFDDESTNNNTVDPFYATSDGWMILDIPTPAQVDDNRHIAVNDGQNNSYVRNVEVAARGDITVTGQLAGDWGAVKIDAGVGKSQVYSFTTDDVGQNKVKIANTIEETLLNFVSAVNGGPGAGTRYGPGILPNLSVIARLDEGTKTAIIEAIIWGEVGNAIKIQASGDVLTAQTGKLNGGINQSLNIDFVLDKLSPDITKVHGVQINNNVNKVGKGAVKTVNKITVYGDTGEGVASALSNNPAWKYTVFDKKPDGGEWTPETISGATLSVEHKPAVPG